MKAKTIEQAHAELRTFTERMAAVETERKEVRRGLAVALVTGAETHALERRAAELDALLSAAPGARAVLENEFRKAEAAAGIVDARRLLEVKTYLSALEEIESLKPPQVKGVSHHYTEHGASLGELNATFKRAGMYNGWSNPPFRLEPGALAAALEKDVAGAAGPLEAGVQAIIRDLEQAAQAEPELLKAGAVSE